MDSGARFHFIPSRLRVHFGHTLYSAALAARGDNRGEHSSEAASDPRGGPPSTLLSLTNECAAIQGNGTSRPKVVPFAPEIGPLALPVGRGRERTESPGGGGLRLRAHLFIRRVDGRDRTGRLYLRSRPHSEPAIDIGPAGFVRWNVWTAAHGSASVRVAFPHLNI
jgi:hypothetical protein